MLFLVLLASSATSNVEDKTRFKSITITLFSASGVKQNHTF